MSTTKAEISWLTWVLFFLHYKTQEAFLVLPNKCAHACTWKCLKVILCNSCNLKNPLLYPTGKKYAPREVAFYLVLLQYMVRTLFQNQNKAQTVIHNTYSRLKKPPIFYNHHLSLERCEMSGSMNKKTLVLFGN